MLLHLPVGLSSRQTAQRRLSGAHNDRSQSHRQWLAVTAPAGRAYAVGRGRPTCRREPRCCQTKQVPKKGVEGRRREARRRPKKLRFISRGQKALAHPSLLPLSNALALRQPTPLLATLITVTIETYHTPSPQTVTHAHCRSYNPACHDSHTYLFRNGTRAVTRNTGCRRPER